MKAHNASRIVASALALSALLGACRVWGELENPVDPEAPGYQGYETVKSPAEFGVAGPADGKSYAGEAISGLRLSASKFVGALGYRFQVASSPDFALASIVWDGVQAENVAAPAFLDLPNGTLYWRVALWTADSWTDWSETRRVILSDSAAPVRAENVAAPVFSLAGGTYDTDKEISLSCISPDAVILYTTDGSEPGAGSQVYRNDILIPLTGSGTSLVLRAVAIKPGMLPSAIVSASYAIDRCAQPYFSPSGGVFSRDQSVSLLCDTAAADIRYSLDGNPPTASSPLYTIPIEVKGVGTTVTIMAAAFKTGIADSATARADYSIRHVAVTDLSLDRESLALAVGGASASLVASVFPPDASDLSVTWASDAPSVASVSQAGLVSPGLAGTATITATSVDGLHVASCLVTVGTVSVTELRLDQASLRLSLGRAGQSLVPTVLPADASDKYLTWVSSAPLVASVSPEGLVTPLANGKATIMATSRDGNKTASCAVSVGPLSAATLGQANLSSLSSDYAKQCQDGAGNLFSIGTAGTNYNPATLDFGAGVTIEIPSSKNVAFLTKSGSDGNAIWARSFLPTTGWIGPASIAPDGSGGVYMVGNISCGTEAPINYDFGNGVNLTATRLGKAQGFLARFDADGKTLWAETATCSGDIAYIYLYSLAANAEGVYVAGYCDKRSTYASIDINWGDGVVTSTSASDMGGVLAKYSPAGLVQWARPVMTGYVSTYNDVALTPSGDVVVGGSIRDAATYTLVAGTDVSGTSGCNSCALLASFSSAGAVNWSSVVTGGLGNYGSAISALAVGAGGEVYAACDLGNTYIFNFGNGLSLTSGNGSAIVKYNSLGLAQWARTADSASSYVYYRDLALDAAGSIFGAGYVYGIGTWQFGDYTVKGIYDNQNFLAVKYGGDGTLAWAQGLSAAPSYGYGYYESIIPDGEGGARASGFFYYGEYDFGGGLVVIGAATSHNALVVHY